MDIYEYLMQPKLIDRRIRDRGEQIDTLRAIAGVTAPRTATSAGEDEKKAILERACELEQENACDLELYRRISADISEMISVLPKQSWRVILRLRFIGLETVREVADETGLEQRSVKRLQQQALQALRETVS